MTNTIAYPQNSEITIRRGGFTDNVAPSVLKWRASLDSLAMVFEAKRVIEDAAYSSTAPLDVALQFPALADEWHREVGGHSSPARILSHPAYLSIIAMGERAIPLILGDLQQRGGDWYGALRAILRSMGQLPPPVPVGLTARQVREIWLNWGRGRGYLDN